MADREFVFDGSPRWSAPYALRLLTDDGALDQVEPTLAALVDVDQPVPRDWLGDRLSVLWTSFMASRSHVDASALTLWLSEHMRLLGDLPHDIVALAIDRAVQTARHGFVPSIGEIRAIAEPLRADRARMIDQLRKVQTLMESAGA